MPYARSYRRRTNYRRRPTYRRKAASTRAPYRRRSTVTANVKKYVKSSISRSVENKISNPFVFPAWSFTSPNTGTTPLTLPSMLDVTQALQSIPQGVGQGNRVGNRIHLKRLPFKFFLSTPLRNGAKTTAVCRLIIAKQKNDLDAPALPYFSSLMQTGSTTEPPDNTMQSVYGPLNKDLWTIKYDKRFILRSPPDTYPSDAAVTPNIYKIITVDIAKFLPKHILYNDTAASPSNTGLYAFMLMCDATNVYTDVMTVKCPIQSWAEYEDA